METLRRRLRATEQPATRRGRLVVEPACARLGTGCLHRLLVTGKLHTLKLAGVQLPQTWIVGSGSSNPC